MIIVSLRDHPAMFKLLISIFHHPLIMVSILLLLINDHVLKHFTPSWLTGKLSDFAGLCFFPFLLALGLCPLFKQQNSAIRAAFFLTASVFVAMKTSPTVNHALVGFSQGLFGITPHIVLDPTDLIALIALWPAWVLWKHVGCKPLCESRSKTRDIALIAIASISALASTPACPVAPDDGLRLMVLEEKLYAGVILQTIDPEVYTYSSTWEPHWYLWRAPNKVLIDMLYTEPPELPYVACNPDEKLTCYRIDGSARIDISHDGGRTWQIDWQIPPGRLEVIRRLPPDFCGYKPDPGLKQLVVFPTSTGTVVVAAGNEGTVIKDADKDWIRVPVGVFVPSSHVPESLGAGLLLLATEVIVAGLVSFVGYLILILWIYKTTASGSPRVKLVPHWVVRPGMMFIFVLFSIFLIRSFNQDDYFLRVILSITAFPGLIFVIFIYIFILTLKNDQNFEYTLTVSLATASLFFLPIGFLILWLFAVISEYSHALILSVVVPLLIYIACFRRLIRTYHPVQDSSGS